MKPFRAPGWLTGIAIAAVAAVNLAGLWGIAMARQAAIGEARRAFGVEVTSRATALESRLSGVRADLAFLGGSPTIARLDEARHSPEEASLVRQGAESALLLFLRSRSEVVRIVVRAADGRLLVHLGRRGGVPILWVSASPTGEEGAAVDPTRPRLTAVLPYGQEAGLAGGVVIETEVEPSALLGDAVGSAETPRSCVLSDASGAVLARRRAMLHRPEAEGERQVVAEAPVRAEGWSLPGPLVLACEQPEGTVVGLAEPVWARYRTTFALNAGVMALALLLGGFAVQQARRRARLEARAAEEARVRELERQLFHAERLTTVGRLAAGIAHEINNPLEGMSNYLTLARDALAREDVEAAQRHVVSVRQGLDRAAGIVRQVLAHADPAKAPKTPLDLNEVLRETEQFVESRRDFGHIRFVLDLAEGALLVRGSPVMLGQVAVNLILNACEVQPEDGEVWVASRREGEQAIVEFSDRGPGVSEADRARVFEPFFSTTDSTGLGLSICHTIVRQHDGELTVHPREGGGSSFRMTLPALTDARAETTEAAPVEDGSAKE
jgi:signal transduction histidine kinase